ncbi:MAG: transcription antitermination factor NusB [Actinomycetales bacterium]|nr:transcription antitermination factor NusB [Actinomycetales bacterium]
MSARSKARKAALDLLYESDIRRANPELLLNSRIESLEYLIRDYTKDLVLGVSANKVKIDELIQTYAQGWDFDRMPVIDRNLLRIALFEILYREDIPAAVAISEALELAQTLSTEESARYVNGILATIEKIKTGLVI